jgi:lipoate-protein ligase B
VTTASLKVAGGTDVRWLGLTDYVECLGLQRELHRSRVAGESGDTLLLTEHRPVFTIGRCGGVAPTLDAPLLARAGIPLVQVERGGNITYHGPGQLVAYPIVSLRERGLTAIGLIDCLELACQDLLAGLGVDAERRPKLRGLWVGGDKIASIGIYVSRGVSMHGVALNLDPDLNEFGLIEPCALPGVRPTSAARILARRLHVEEHVEPFTDYLERRMGSAKSS